MLGGASRENGGRRAGLASLGALLSRKAKALFRRAQFQATKCCCHARCHGQDIRVRLSDSGLAQLSRCVREDRVDLAGVGQQIGPPL